MLGSIENPYKISFSNQIPGELMKPLSKIPISPKIDPFPFFLINPSGFNNWAAIRNFIESKSLKIDGVFPIDNYELVARHLYNVQSNNILTFSWILLFRHFFQEFHNNGIVIVLKRIHLSEYNKIVHAKIDLRQYFGAKYYLVEIGGQTQKAALNFIHAPDYARLAEEAIIVSSLCNISV